jgi:hypothetical protein
MVKHENKVVAKNNTRKKSGYPVGELGTKKQMSA